MSKLSLSIVVKSLLLLFLGPGNNNSPVYNNVTTSNISSSDMELFIPGTYKLESNYNFDLYLQEMGVNYFLRQLAMLAQPTVTIAIHCDGKNITIEKDIASIPTNRFSSNNNNTTPNSTANTTSTMLLLSSPTCLVSILTDAGIKTHELQFVMGKEVSENVFTTVHDDAI